MNNKNTIVGIVVAVVLVAGITFFATRSQAPAPTPAPTVSETPSATTTGSTSTSPSTPSGAKQFTMAEVATHNSAASCYSAVRGNVYDLTAWIGSHPGGKQAILSICGKDGTAAFEGQHGGQRRPESELKGFEIGVVAK